VEGRARRGKREIRPHPALESPEVRIGRIITLLAIAAVAYAVFMATPSGGRTPDAFDPARVASFETAVLKGLKERNDFAIVAGTVRLLREQQRYSWWQAVTAGYPRARALTTLAQRQNRFEVVLPQLESSLAVEQRWRQASFSPGDAARAELRWRTALRQPQINSDGRIADMMADELALRYRTSAADMRGAAQARTSALRMLDEAGDSPDWDAVEADLASAYRALLEAIRVARPRTAS